MSKQKILVAVVLEMAKRAAPTPQQLRLTEWPAPSEKLVHDWRGYVPDVLREAWFRLSHQERAIIYLVSHEAAQREEWE